MAMTVVFEFPPKESCSAKQPSVNFIRRKNVSFLKRSAMYEILIRLYYSDKTVGGPTQNIESSIEEQPGEER